MLNDDDVVIAAYRRSPFHFAHKGELTKVRPDEMAAQVVRALLSDTGVDPATIEDVVVGCAFPEGEQGLNVAKLIAFIAGLPESVAGATVNRFCGSSMQSVHQAAGAIRMGAGEAFLCAGVESMTRVPMMGFNPMPHPGLAERYPQAFISMGETAENVARRHQVTRGDQEAFAVRSHLKAAEAQATGRLEGEIVPIETGKAGQRVTQDGCIRPDTTAEGLAGLKAAFRQDGTVTAGTSSPLTDGAAAVLVCTGAYAKRHGLTPLARVRSVAVAGCAPEVMGMGPVEATRKALARAGISARDLDVVELNEAFASQALACMRELGLDEAKVNKDGGAIALGHPLGATGARITGKAAQVLRRDGGRYALATQCIGGGQGIATVLEAV
jgi:acetyl-CoA acyltransferase